MLNSSRSLRLIPGMNRVLRRFKIDNRNRNDTGYIDDIGLICKKYHQLEFWYAESSYKTRTPTSFEIIVYTSYARMVQ